MNEFFETDADRELREKIKRSLETMLNIPVRKIDIYKYFDSTNEPIVRIEISFKRTKEPQSSSLIYDTINVVGSIVENVELPYPAVILPYLDQKQKLAENA